MQQVRGGKNAGRRTVDGGACEVRGRGTRAKKPVAVHSGGGL